MAPNRVVVFKILFLVLIAHLFLFIHFIETSKARKQNLGENEQLERTQACRVRSAIEDNDNRQTADEDSYKSLHKSNNRYGPKQISEKQQINTSKQLRKRQVTTRNGTNTTLVLDESAELVADSNGSSGEFNILNSSIGFSPRRSGAQSSSDISTSQETTASDINVADLCFLTNGGSSLTLAVNEATLVGALIGTVDVTGDPSLEGGNVELSVEGSEQQQQTIGSGDHWNGVLQKLAPSIAGSTTIATSIVGRQQRRLLGRRDTNSNSPQPLARLEQGTRNLILARPLDKESAEAEQTLSVLVRCKPRLRTSAAATATTGGRNQQTSSTIIPIRVIVTDANDHAPEFLPVSSSHNDSSSGLVTYTLSVSETAPIGSVLTREIQAIDRDAAQGPHTTIHYRVLDTDSSSSSLSSCFAFANPLEPVLSLAAPLDYESLAQTNQTTFMLTIQAQDEAEPEPLASTAQVQVNVIDFDDQNPRFLDDKYTLVIDEQQTNSVGQNLMVQPRQLEAEDGDRGIMAPIIYSFDQLDSTATSSSSSSESLVSIDEQDDQDAALLESNEFRMAHNNPSANCCNINVQRYLNLNPSTGELRLIRPWPRARWPQVGWPLTLVVRATQSDNRDRYALTTLTISSPPLPSGHHIVSKSSSSQQTHKSSQGLTFVRDKLVLEVGEDARIGDSIVQVKALLQDQEQTNRQDSSDQQQVDLIASSLGAKEVLAEKLPAKSQAKVQYQILDDQTGQFSINELGELSLKRALDYEQKQEYKIRVLATHQKYSDICHVQVNVLNVNDNKPKFTQTQYSFHLTESRLRSNAIGSVQAHDADLNDTIRYSLVWPSLSDNSMNSNNNSNNLRALLDLNELTGQLSLKANARGTSLNVNSGQFQFQVQASDSLGPINKRHKQLARVLLHVAPQIIGRSINLDSSSLGSSDELAIRQSLSRNRLLSSTSTSTSSSGQHNVKNQHFVFGDQASQQQQFTSESSNIIQMQSPPAQHFSGPIQVSNQRSSLATVMSSFQHMMRSVNFLEMPMGSALLLSALLAFLLCLLLIVIISMSVHIYKRRTKLTARRRHMNAAAAHLRHAQHLTNPNGMSTPIAGPNSGYFQASAISVASKTALRVQQEATNNSKQALLRHRAMMAHHKASSSPSAGSSSMPSSSSSAGVITDNVTEQSHLNAPEHSGAECSLRQPTDSHKSQLKLEISTISTGQLMASPGQSGKPSATRTSNKSLSVLSSLTPSSTTTTTAMTTPKSESGQTEIRRAQPKQNQTSPDNGQLRGGSIERRFESSPSGGAPTPSSSICSSSIGMNRGHYSVTNTMENVANKSGQMRTTSVRQQRKEEREENSQLEARVKADAAAARSSLEAAIRSLVKQDGKQEDEEEYLYGKTQRTSSRLWLEDGTCGLTSTSDKQRMKATQLANELAGVARGRPDVKSYRKLPLMSSLNRQSLNRGQHRVAPMPDDCQHQQSSGTLMALVRAGGESSSNINEQAIRWPSNAFAQRVKKLTWDDELSIASTMEESQSRHLNLNSDCFVAPDIQLDGPISPLGAEHKYQQIKEFVEQQQPENYLFSAGRFESNEENHNIAALEICVSPMSPSQHQAPSSSSSFFHHQPNSLLSNANNCLDYTIVQNSSQFQVDSLHSNMDASKTGPSYQQAEQHHKRPPPPPPAPQLIVSQNHYAGFTKPQQLIRSSKLDSGQTASDYQQSNDLTRQLLMNQRPSAVL